MTMFTILLVEDNESWQSILQLKINYALEQINHTDYKIKVINNFQEAFKALQESSWNLVVTDIGLGNDDMQPQKLGKQLVQLAYNRNVPAIVVSGTEHLNSGEVRELLKKLGACDFFYKGDFDDDEFINKIQEVLQKEEQPQEANFSTHDEYKLSDVNRKYLVATLSSLATNALIPAKEYFKKLVQELRYPEEWKQSIADVWTGDANRDAERLIKWCEQKKICPQDYCETSAYTALGCLAEKLLEETADIQIFEIIQQYKLITDESILESLKYKYSNSN